MILLRRMPDVLCPKCVEPGGLAVFQSFKVKPTGEWSLTGPIKLSVIEILVLDCTRCEWTVKGYREGDQGVFPDPHGPSVGTGQT